MEFDFTTSALVPIGQDASTSDPFWRDDNYKDDGFSESDKIGMVDLAAMQFLTEYQLNCVSYTPFGRFVIEIVVELAFKDKWEYTDPKDDSNPPSEVVLKRLQFIDSQVDIRSLTITAAQHSRRYGRSAFCRIWVGKDGQKTKAVYRICRLPENWVHYDEETGEIDQIYPMIPWGRGRKQFTINKEDFVIFKNRIDPNGNGEQGIPELVAVFRVIKWDSNILKAFDKTIYQRGIGLVDVTVEGARNEEDLNKWKRKYGNPAQYATFFHSERVTVDTKDGIKPGYDISHVSDIHRHQVSAGTGNPGERMIGVQTGAVTGSETDQDNMAEIYKTIHDVNDEYIIKVYEMLDPELKGKFGMVFPINTRLDPEKEANILSLNTKTVLESADFIKVGTAEKLLDYEIHESDAESNMTFAEYIDAKRKKRGLPTEAEEVKMQMENMRNNEGPEQKTPNRGPPNAQTKEEERDSIKQAFLTRFPDKDSGADYLLNQLQYSLNETQDHLQFFYGEGMSRSNLVEIRNGNQ